MDTRKRNGIFLTLIGLTLMFLASHGQVQAGHARQRATDFAAIDTYVREQVNRLGVPGIALGIVQEGQIAHLQGFGVTDSSGRAVTPQTPFFLGSVTKSFTALAVMQLVEAGKIDLDAPVQAYLPWFEVADRGAATRITVRDLLNQTTGLSTKSGNSLWASGQGLEEVVRGFDRVQLTQPVGTVFQYSNLNFMIAGLIVEEVSGLSYDGYVSRHIFAPLGMDHSHTARADALADGLAREHYYMFGRVFELKGPQPPANLAAGALIASAEDMTHYMIAQLNEGHYGNISILSPQGIAELHAPAVSSADEAYYGMGWSIGTRKGTPLVWHSGDDGRSHADVLLAPGHNMGVVLLANASGFAQRTQIDDLALNVLDMLGGNAPVAVSLPFLLRFLYWSVLLTPPLMILGIVLMWRRRRKAALWQVLLIGILYLAIVFFILSLSLSEITLRSMLVFHPEIGAGLLAIAAIGIGWTVFYMAMYVTTRRHAAYRWAYPSLAK
jgi:CubicO group peptidase (beta-lactamase class C family)